MTGRHSYGGPMLTRRHFLHATAAATAAVAVTGSMIGAAAAAPPSPDTPAVLPVKYGTPTDLARTSKQQAWTREPDGTVVTFDHKTLIWVKATETDWAQVLGYGGVHLARWGRSSGNDHLVMVFATPPVSPPPPPTTSTPPPTGNKTPPPTRTGNPPPPTTTAQTVRTASTPPPTATAPPPLQTSGPTSTTGPAPGPAPGPGGQPPPLADTGFGADRLTTISVAAIGVGAGLTFLRRRARAITTSEYGGDS